MFKASIVEFIGTFFIVLALAASGNPLAAAIMIMIMVYGGAHISGGQYNPAVTLGMLSIGKIQPRKALTYVVAQFLGGFAAMGVFVFLGGKSLTVTPASTATFLQAAVAEFIFTFLLVSTICFTMVHKKAHGNSYFGIAIGLCVLVGAITVGPLSGGVFNPVVGIVPQVYRHFTGGGFTPENIALYTVAPVLGALFAAQLYEFLREKSET